MRFGRWASSSRFRFSTPPRSNSLPRSSAPRKPCCFRILPSPKYKPFARFLTKSLDFRSGDAGLFDNALQIMPKSISANPACKSKFKKSALFESGIRLSTFRFHPVIAHSIRCTPCHIQNPFGIAISRVIEPHRK